MPAAITLVVVLTTVGVIMMSQAGRRQQVIRELERIGFSLYEARAYVALLESQPANGYDLARTSGIPASKIYETLQRLVTKGAILASANEPTVYRAVSPDDLIDGYRQETENSLRFLLDSLPQLTSEPAPGIVWRLRGARAITQRLLRLLNDASGEIYLSVWPSEAAYLVDAISAARQRGLQVWVASFGPCPITGDCVYDLLSCGESSSARLGKRLTAAVADGRQTIVAEFGDDLEATGTLAEDASLALATREYIIHDLVNHTLIEEIGLERFTEMREKSPLLAGILGPIQV